MNSVTKLDELELLEDGRVLITVSVNEKIPTAKYASTDIFAAVKFLHDDPVEGIRFGFKACEAGMEPERDAIIEELESGN